MWWLSWLGYCYSTWLSWVRASLFTRKLWRFLWTNYYSVLLIKTHCVCTNWGNCCNLAVAQNTSGCMIRQTNQQWYLNHILWRWNSKASTYEMSARKQYTTMPCMEGESWTRKGDNFTFWLCFLFQIRPLTWGFVQKLYYLFIPALCNCSERQYCLAVYICCCLVDACVYGGKCTL